MTGAKLASKLRKLREEHEDAEMEAGELNLVPFLDIVTNVIMFLMMTTTFAAALADINVSSPRVNSGASAENTPPPDEIKQDLNLTLSISDKGYTVAASGAVLYENDVPGKLPTLPKIGKEYDTNGLIKKMRQIKDQFDAETKVIINANGDITYENVVSAMDACRVDNAGKTLFPDVLLSAGVQ